MLKLAERLIPLSILNLLNCLKLYCIGMWKKVWRREPGCSQTRLWFPDSLRSGLAFDIIRLPKVICSQITQFITGHCLLNRHQALIDNRERSQYIMNLPVDEREDGEEIIGVS